MSQSAIITVTPAFKKEASRAILSIVTFIVVYLLLFALASCLALACMGAGVFLMIEIPRFLTLLLGAGLIGLGVMVFVFLIKFLFARSSSDESDSIEVKEKDQPELVAFIHQIAKETNTPVPKKIFLSPEVNACVFYHSSFWSMFFPVRKNLKIGLGLVNAVNVSELKAVIAHEFGHFSQRSMKVGSYVYQVNRIIYDMLYNNKGYVSSLQGFARVSNIFALFAQLTIIIVQGIQWILIQMFSVVNKSHRSLSRQMEFHADHVAAAVSGSNNMISALRRIELADSCYQAAIDVCNSFWNENKVVANIYAGQSTVLQLNAPRWQIELQNGLPLMDQAPQHKTANRVNFKDQWASHPTLEDRVAQLEKLGLEAPVQSDAAWSLFVQVEELKKELTRKLYRNLPAGEQKSVADAASFEEVYSDQVKHYSLPKEYKGFYDDRQIEIMDIEEVLHTIPLDQPLEELLSGHNVGLYKNIQATAYDIEVLKAIESKQLDVKSFDFDGYKYKRQEAASIREQLEKELDDQKKRLTTLDQQITACFCLMAMNKSVEKEVALKEQYRTYFNHRREADAWLDSLQSTMNPLQPIYAGETLTFEVIEGLINTLTHQNEPVVKTGLKNWLAKGAFDKNALLKQKVENFIGSTYTYFENKKFLEEQLKDLNQIVQEGWTAVQEFLFEEFKAILEGQRSLLKEDTSSMNVLVS